ncbi:MAG: ATP-binding cassette domain-containing protein, partial [Thermomicrobiales bacterium]
MNRRRGVAMGTIEPAGARGTLAGGVGEAPAGTLKGGTVTTTTRPPVTEFAARELERHRAIGRQGSMTEQNAAIQVHGLRKSYEQLQVLKGVDFDVARGSIFALLGSNGAGKTTVVRILTTLLKPDGGTARVNGCDVL